MLDAEQNKLLAIRDAKAIEGSGNGGMLMQVERGGGHYDALLCLHQQPSTKACCGGFSQRQTITWKGCLKELAIELAIEEELAAKAAKKRKVS